MKRMSLILLLSWTASVAVAADGIKRPGLHNKFGRIHWCGHGHGIFWRNIRIRELP